MMELAESASRVERNTSKESNHRIAATAAGRIEFYRSHPEEITARLRELDKEWDIERALETGSSTLSLLGLTLGLTRSRKWLILPVVVQGFFLQHALQGWCPPLPVFRKLGFRTLAEIERERCALKELQTGKRPLKTSSRR